MSHRTDTLRMPEHRIDAAEGNSIPEYLTSDRFFPVKPCKGSTEPGYAHMNPDGTLHCNRCGWTTPEPVITSYSPDTDSTYLTWDDLVAAEANGWVVIGTVDRPNTSPVLVGPFDTQDDARRARSRLRAKWVRQERQEHGDGVKVSTLVRPLWKENL